MRTTVVIIPRDGKYIQRCLPLLIAFVVVLSTTGLMWAGSSTIESVFFVTMDVETRKKLAAVENYEQ
jgi:hypothetical protein